MDIFEQGAVIRMEPRPPIDAPPDFLILVKLSLHQVEQSIHGVLLAFFHGQRPALARRVGLPASAHVDRMFPCLRHFAAMDFDLI